MALDYWRCHFNSIVLVQGPGSYGLGRKIPELMKGLGSGIKEFKNATKEEEEKPKVEEEKKA